ncbi:MAG: DUF4139 domain-containing protein [Rhodothalassiaceae bacterium]
MTPKRHFRTACSAALLMTSASAGAGEAIVSRAEDRNDLTLTIYNDGIAMVREQREIAIGKGRQRLELSDVSAGIIAPSAILEMDGVSIIEQNFDYDLLTPEALIAKAVGREVQIYRPHPETGEDRVETARILAANNGVILEIGGRIESLDRLPGRIVFRDLPPTLRERPTLSTLLESRKSGKRGLSLSYLSRGFNWRADYAAILAPDEKSMSVRAWITLTNKSGTDFRDAKTQLVAGSLHLVESNESGFPDRSNSEILAMARFVKTESLADYHLYSLPVRTDIANNQTKQVALFEADQVAVEKDYQIEFWDFQTSDIPKNAEVWLRTRNDRDHGLGQPLPQGIFRVYGRDMASNMQFLGEDQLPGTAENDPVGLRIGNAFDVTVTGRNEGRELVEKSRDRQIMRETQSYRINNGRKEAVRVRLVQTIPALSFELAESSTAPDRIMADEIVWTLEVPAKGSTELRFVLRTEN